MRWRTVAVASALLLFTGCGGPPTQTVQHARGTVMLVAPTKPDVVMLAGVGGTLVRTARGCMILEIGDGEEMITQFPYGSTLTANGQGITLPDQTTVHLGGSISGAGGVGDPGRLKHVPLQCVSAAKVLYLQAV